MGWQDRTYGREYGESTGRLSFPRPTTLAAVLIGVNLLIFIVQVFAGGHGVFSPWVEYGALTFRDGLALKQPWRWITYQYLHAGGLHIFFNCLGIFFFLPPLERRWGWSQTFLFYTAGGIAAGVVYGLISAFGHVQHPLIGASGSILAALGACALLFPQMQIVLLFFLVPIRLAAGLFAVLYLLTIMGDRNLSDAAHLGGLAFGFVTPWLFGGWLRRVGREMQIRRVRRMAEAEQHDQEAVDVILQKVHDHGMNSLTRGERKTLRRATERQRQRDLELSRRR